MTQKEIKERYLATKEALVKLGENSDFYYKLNMIQT